MPWRPPPDTTSTPATASNAAIAAPTTGSDPPPEPVPATVVVVTPGLVVDVVLVVVSVVVGAGWAITRMKSESLLLAATESVPSNETVAVWTRRVPAAVPICDSAAEDEGPGCPDGEIAEVTRHRPAGLDAPCRHLERHQPARSATAHRGNAERRREFVAELDGVRALRPVVRHDDRVADRRSRRDLFLVGGDRDADVVERLDSARHRRGVVGRVGILEADCVAADGGRGRSIRSQARASGRRRR